MEVDPAVTEYHAHIYYRTPQERAAAETVRSGIERRFTVRMGRWRDEPVGPHPAPMFQVAFLPDVLQAILPWLMVNRGGLVVLVHPETGRPRDDHLKHAAWMGEVLRLDGMYCRKSGELIVGLSWRQEQSSMTLPVFATLTVLSAGLAVFMLAPAAHAKPCPPPLCATADACKQRADWVVEGRVLEFMEGGYDPTCHTTYPFLSQVCVSPKEPPTVLLDHAVEVRGRAELVAQGMATLPEQPSCPLQIATQTGPIQPYDPGSAMVGKHYRFYGFNARPGSNAGPVYVIAEPALGAMLPH